MNLHGLAATRPSTWRVCQFRHSRRIRRPVNGTAKLRNCDGDAVLLSIYLLPAGSQAPRHLPHSFAQDGLPAGHRPISPTAKPTAHLYNATGSAASFRTVRFSHRRSPTKTPPPHPQPPTADFTVHNCIATGLLALWLPHAAGHGRGAGAPPPVIRIHASQWVRIFSMAARRRSGGSSAR